jgi:hypothetical protein
MEETAVLKVSRSINHRKEGFRALMEADRGAEYSNASYPNP